MTESTSEAGSGPEYRAVFEAHVAFSNGGELSAEGFRVDVPGPDVTVQQVGERTAGRAPAGATPPSTGR